MNDKTYKEANYRYPGSRPFYDTDLDRSLFFGRTHEKESLLHKVLAENLVVLYAKSGLGKTSLLNAGLNNALREKGFIPLMIRFNNPDHEPVKCIYEEIEAFVEQNNLDYDAGKTESLWQYFKTVAFWSANDTLLKPVLILDQFEEFFTVHSPENRKKFIRELANLVNNKIPEKVLESVPPGKSFPYSEKPPMIKIIISIREDYLGQLEEMSREIPDILHNRFRLLPLNCEQAGEAIAKPSEVEHDAIGTPSFKYSSEAVKMMLNFLCKRKERDGVKITDEVEPFQLQLLCHHNENKIQVRADRGEGDIIVETDDLGGEAGMQQVLQSFYDDQIKKLDSFWKKRRTRKLCEKGLISLTDRRLSLEEEEIKRKFRISGKLLAELVKCRLLRSEPRVGSIYYELSHDTLVAPIRESQKKVNFIKHTAGGFIVICFLIIIGLIIINANQRIDETRVESYLDMGQEFYERKNFDGAAEIYNKAIDKGINNAEIYHRLGQISFAKGEKAEAIKNYKAALKLNKELRVVYIDLALLYIKNGEPSKALEVYQQALEVNPENADIYWKIAEALKEKGDEESLAKIYTLASESGSKEASHYFKLGYDYWELEMHDYAIKNYQKAIEIDKNYADAYYNMGISLLELKKYNEAIAAFKNAIEIKPEYATAHYNMGISFLKQRKYPEAIEAFKKAIKFKRKYAAAYHKMGIALSSQGKYADAISAYEEALSILNDNAADHKIPRNEFLAYAEKNYVPQSIGSPKKDGIIVVIVPDNANKEEVDESYKKAIEITFTLAEVYYNMGIALCKRGNIEEGIKAFKDATEINPFYFEAFNELGNSLSNQKKYNEAIGVYKKATELNSEYAYAYRGWGNALYEQKKYLRAIDKYNEAIKNNPEDSDAYYGLGNALLKLKRYNESINAFKETIKRKPSFADAYYHMGLAHSELKNYKEAIEAYKKAVEKKTKNDADAYYHMGLAHSELKNYKEAIEAYKKAIVKKTKYDADAYYRMGFGHSELKNYKEAVEAYKKAVEKKTKYEADAYYRIGLGYSKLKKYKEAIKEYKKAVEINTENDDAYCKMGHAYSKLKNYDEAISAYDEAIRINPENSEASLNRQWIIQEQTAKPESPDATNPMNTKKDVMSDNLEDASGEQEMHIFRPQQRDYGPIKVFIKGISVETDDYNPHYNMGIALYKEQKYKLAIKAFQEATKLKSKRADAYFNMGVAYLHLKKYKRAHEAFKNTTENDKINAFAYNNMGFALSQLKNYKDAIRAYKKAIEIEPNHAYFYNGLGSIYFIQGKYKEAIDEFKKAINKSPKYSTAKANLAEAYLITERFDNALKLTTEVLKEKDISTGLMLAIRSVSISSLIFQGKQPEALSQLKEFIKYYQSLPGDYMRNWDYAATKKFLNKSQKLPTQQTQLLLQLVDILESPKKEGNKRLKKLEASLSEIFR